MKGLTKGQSDKFNQAMARINKQQEAESKRQKEQPRLDFIHSAEKVFTRRQAEFMWEWLAQKDHEHWNGMIGS